MRRLHSAIATALVTLAAAGTLHAQPVSAPHVTVELVPEMVSIAPGRPFRVALRFELEKDWHTYWRNPGDAGLAPTLELALPEGFTASEIAWPLPEAFGEAPEVSYGYHDVVLLPVTITPPAALEEDSTITITAKASWLVCKDVCIPGKAELSLPLLVRTRTSAETFEYHREFIATDAQQPKSARKIELSARRAGDTYEIVVANVEGRKTPMPTSARFFPYDEGIIDHSAAQVLERTDSTIVIRMPVSPYEQAPPTHLRGVLIAEPSWNVNDLRAIAIEAPIATDTNTNARKGGK